MIAPVRQPHRRSDFPAWHAQFLAMLPAIVTHARISFRHRDPETRDDLVEEVVSNALVAFVRLVELNKTDLAYPTVLARFAVAQVKDGRRVGNRLNVRDVLSPYCQRRKSVLVERLDKFDAEDNVWQEIIVEDRHAGPAEVATTRMDFAAWLRTLPGRLRRIAKVLANGETTGGVARRFHVSPGRISQIRTELKQAWERFQGEATAPAPAA